MELKQLYGLIFLLILIGSLIGISVIMLDKMATSASDIRTVVNESFVMPIGNTTVTLSNGNITRWNGIINATSNVHPPSNYTINLTSGVINNSEYSEGLITNKTCKYGQTCYANYVYREYDTEARSSLFLASGAVGSIATVWLGLIVTIVILIFLLGLLITGLGGAGRK